MSVPSGWNSFKKSTLYQTQTHIMGQQSLSEAQALQVYILMHDILVNGSSAIKSFSVSTT
jgi:hypothetical protein